MADFWFNGAAASLLLLGVAPVVVPEVVPEMVESGPPPRARSWIGPERAASFLQFGPSTVISAPIIPGRGPAGVFTLVLDIADSARTLYAWPVDVIPTFDGTEQRIVLVGCPVELYNFSSVLTDSQLAELQSRIAYEGALGSIFLVGLSYEALTLQVDAPGATVTVLDTSKSDWCYAGQRVVIVQRHSEDVEDTVQATFDAVVQSVTPTTIALDVAPGVVFGRAGNLIMPAVACYLNNDQQGGLHPNNAGRLDLRAHAILFGNATSDWAPVGAVVTSYDDPDTTVFYSVWDRFLSVDEASSRAARLGNEIVDRGAVIQNKGKLAYAQFIRQVKCVIDDDEERQWFKAFIGATRGRQLPFLLPTWKPDLRIVAGDASTGTIQVYGPPTLEAADYAGKYHDKSQAHQWLQIRMTSGAIFYRKVIDASDNLDGTQDILLDSAAAGTIDLVSFLELVRFETDEYPIEWEGGLGYVDLEARVVQG